MARGMRISAGLVRVLVVAGLASELGALLDSLAEFAPTKIAIEIKDPL